MDAVFSYSRVAAYPGKHGGKDLRVEFAGEAPTHEEILAALWLIFSAEDRYDNPGNDGRRMLMELIEEVYEIERMDFMSILAVLERVKKTKPAFAAAC